MKKIIYLFVVLIAVTSCNGFLDKNPDNRASLDSPENLAYLLVSAYPSYSHVWFTELMTDNATDVGPTAPLNSDNVEQSYRWERVSGINQNSPDGFWFACYEAIASANHVLEAVEKFEKSGEYPLSKINPIKGEALMCRAYAHFMLVNLFSEHYNPNTASSLQGVPYVTKPETRPIEDYTSISVEAVYKAIEKDFTLGFPLIEDDVYLTPKWHFNRKAAASFISRFYLYRALPGDWDKVVEYTDIALEGNPKGFLRDWLGTYNLSFDAFGYEYSRSTNPANFLIISSVSTGTRAWAYRYTMDLELVRKRVVYGEPHPTNASIQNRYVMINKAAGSSTAGCYSVVKHKEDFKRDGVNSNYGLPYVMYTPIVAEEALFNQMEAEVMRENYGKVIELLNLYYSTRVMDYSPTKDIVTENAIIAKYSGNEISSDITPHFTMTSKQKTYMKCIINIRASEFVGEGQRWFDIKRMHIPIVHTFFEGGQIELTSNDERRIIPLPDAVGELPFLKEGTLEPPAENLDRKPLVNILNSINTEVITIK